MSNGAMGKFLGGPPLLEEERLLLLCVLVGFILSAMGFEAIWWMWRYFLLGAVIVIPIWLIVRLAKGGRT